MRLGVGWWVLKACERLPFLTPEVFDRAPREKQVALLVYAQERDLEELERAGSLALGNALTAPEADSKRDE